MKKILSAILITLTLAFSLTSCNEKESKKEIKKTVIGYRTGALCQLPLHLAILNGYLDEEFKAIGQEVEAFHTDVGSSTTATLISSGKLDGGQDLIASMIPQMDNGLSIVWVTGLHKGCTRYLVRADSDIQSVKDLKGRKVGVFNLTDSSVITLKRKLAQVGISVSQENPEVDFRVFEMSTLGQVLKNGEVDAIALHEPVVTKTQNEYGFREILNTSTDEYLKDEYCCESFVSRDYYESNPEGVKAYVRAMQKAAAFVQANPEEAEKVALAENFVSGTLEGNVAILKTLDFTPSYSKGMETFKKQARELKEIGILKSTTDVDKFLEDGIAKIEGISEGFIYNPETKEFTEIK